RETLHASQGTREGTREDRSATAQCTRDLFAAPEIDLAYYHTRGSGGMVRTLTGAFDYELYAPGMDNLSGQPPAREAADKKDARLVRPPSPAGVKYVLNHVPGLIIQRTAACHAEASTSGATPRAGFRGWIDSLASANRVDHDHSDDDYHT